jgi:DNA-binding NarL/FixJ family response regulator
MVVDDHLVVRQGLRGMLAGTDDVEVVGEASSGQEAMTQAAALHPDVILLDIRMPGLDGLKLISLFKRNFPDLKIIILTQFDDEQFLLEAFKAGAYAYFLKNVGREELLEAIRAVHQGKRILSKDLMDTVLTQFQDMAQDQAKHQFGLSETDIKLLRLVAEGATNREIANQMYWSEATAKRKLSDVYRKLDVSDRAQCIAVAARHGLL